MDQKDFNEDGLLGVLKHMKTVLGREKFDEFMTGLAGKMAGDKGYKFVVVVHAKGLSVSPIDKDGELVDGADEGHIVSKENFPAVDVPYDGRFDTMEEVNLFREKFQSLLEGLKIGFTHPYKQHGGGEAQESIAKWKRTLG